MSALREQLANDLARGDMSDGANEETALDRIGALARTDPLGAALWRVTGNLDAGAFLQARRHLVARLESDIPLSENERTQIAQIALQEWLACQCSECGGRRHITNEAGLRRLCPSCHGSGRGTYTAGQRMQALRIGSATYARISHLFEQAHALLTAADARVERQLSYQLGKPLNTKARRK